MFRTKRKRTRRKETKQQQQKKGKKISSSLGYKSASATTGQTDLSLMSVECKWKETMLMLWQHTQNIHVYTSFVVHSTSQNLKSHSNH